MSRTRMTALIAGGVSMALATASWAENRPSAREDAGLIQSAMSAAPASVGREATIIAAGPNGAMRTLRPGTNGFTCMPDDPSTPGNDPMCMDANAMSWVMAMIGHTAPPPNVVGLMYMLGGGSDASNTDPYARAPAAGGGWVQTGPHLMVVGSASLLQGYPGGRAPDTSRPYVMWAGTPYAHLMIPVR